MSPRRWTNSKKQPNAAEKRAAEREKALANCQQGNHSLTKTFRPGEQLCTACNAVFYCPGCLKENHLDPSPSFHAYPVECKKHQKVGVQTWA